MKVLGIIPARYASTRLPAKPLAKIGNITMIERVYQRACIALDHVVVATDHPLIADTCHSFGAHVIITDPSLPSGTARCAAAVRLLDTDSDIIVNIQGDEPFLDPDDITHLVNSFKDPEVCIATLAHRFDPCVQELDTLTDTANPKIIVDHRMNALYFSRAVIPFVRNYPVREWPEHATYYLHKGIYAYRRDTLMAIASLPPCEAEQAEQLEQLRWLNASYPIRIVFSTSHSLSIDTPDDLRRANNIVH